MSLIRHEKQFTFESGLVKNVLTTLSNALFCLALRFHIATI